MKIQKQKNGRVRSGRGEGLGGGGGQGGCEQRIEVFEKKKIFFGGGYDFSLNFTKYSTHHSLSANTGFKSIAFILFEILHLQNCDVKFQHFQRAITKKNHMNFF